VTGADDADRQIERLRWIPAPTYTMGSDQHYPEERPAHKVTVDGFWMAIHQVTNAQYEAFVRGHGILDRR
jgi:formylglycine-generating enzyme required for sulfatase activity